MSHNTENKEEVVILENADGEQVKGVIAEKVELSDLTSDFEDLRD